MTGRQGTQICIFLGVLVQFMVWTPGNTHGLSISLGNRNTNSSITIEIRSNWKSGKIASNRKTASLLLRQNDWKAPIKLNVSSREAASKALLKLTTYIIDLTSKRQLFVLYDDSYPEINKILALSYANWADTVVLNCNSFDVLQFLLKNWRAYPMAMRNMVVLCSSPSVFTLFQQVKARVLESATVSWFVVSQEDTRGQLQQVLREGTQICLFTRQTETKYDLAVTKVNSSGQVRFESAGLWWTNDEGTRNYTSQPLVQDLISVYSSFHGRHLIVSANNNWPFFGLRVLENRRAEPTTGIDVNILNALSRKLNFSYHVEVPPDKAWGGPQKDGTVTGLIGVVARQESNFAICEITITDLRETVVDFTTSYWLESLTLVSRAPKERDRAMAVFWPFSGLVWGLIGLSLLLIGPVAFVFYWLLVTYLDLEENYSLSSTSFNLFRSLVNQGNDLEGNRWPLRFVFLFWYLFCYNIYAMYSGTLTAYLAIPTFEPPIDSLTDLPKAAQDGFTIGTLKASSTEQLFRYADSGIYKEVWGLFDPLKSLLPTPDEGFDKVLAEKFVLINSEMNGEIRATVRGRDKYHFGRDTFYPHAYGIACNSGAPFRPKFDILLSWITEAGLVRRWAQEQINLVRHDVTTGGRSKEGETSYSLTLNHLQAAFFLVFGGFALSVGVLLLENVVVRFFRK